MRQQANINRKGNFNRKVTKEGHIAIYDTPEADGD